MGPDEYQGVETGPIRPPSEAASQLVRVARTCPGNRCRFCPVYKGQAFSRRPIDDILHDIDLVADWVDILRAGQETAERGCTIDAYDPEAERLSRMVMADLSTPHAMQAFRIARRWLAAGGETVFLQDANPLMMPPRDLVRVLEHLRN
ncbi:MAG: radical SAM protein, partial [Chloroflexi bacterium]|nr:radical SAM protein [Chloroflexota bacterium]